MALLGVIGGLGPMATAYFMELITSMTDAGCDQEHMRMLVYSIPDTPDRTSFILGRSQASPLPNMLEAGRALKSLGVDVIAVPCITAHYFHLELETGLGVRILHAIRDCSDLLKESGVTNVGLMATEGTVSTGLFQRELQGRGITLTVPGQEGQRAVTSLIYDDVKRGRRPDMDSFHRVKNELRQRGAEVVLLGCTELSVIKRENDTGSGVLDVMEVLASSAVKVCGKKLSPHLRLIT